MKHVKEVVVVVAIRIVNVIVAVISVLVLENSFNLFYKFRNCWFWIVIFDSRNVAHRGTFSVDNATSFKLFAISIRAVETLSDFDSSWLIDGWLVRCVPQCSTSISLS
jgi:hypothetical protein